VSRSAKLTHATRVQRIRELLESRDHVTIEELVREFGRSRRTIYYDLTALQDAGVPIYSEPGATGEAHWKLHAAAKRRLQGPEHLVGGEEGRGDGGAPVSLELIFDAEQARALRRRQLHPSQRLDELPDGRVQVTLEVSGTRGLLLWLLGHTASVEVAHPPELREEVRTLLRAALARHSRRAHRRKAS